MKTDPVSLNSKLQIPNAKIFLVIKSLGNYVIQ